LEKFLVNRIISFYYPEFEKLKIINKSWINKKDKVLSMDRKKEYASENIISIHKKAQKIAIEKLSILNIIYELSRIQFILQSMQDRIYI
jgi:hypothetical protein